MTEDTNIREKSRAVFLAALMVLSVFAMSASFAGVAAAQNAGDDVEETSAEDIVITNGNTVLSEPVSNAYLENELGFAPADARDTASFDDEFEPAGALGEPFGNLAGETGLLGVPFQEEPYSGLTSSGDLGVGPVRQDYDMTVDVNATESQITLDHSNSLEQGVTVLDPADVPSSTGLSASQIRSFSSPTSGVDVTQVSVNSEAGEIVITLDADSDTEGATVTGFAHLIPGDSTLGIAPTTTTGIDVVLEGEDLSTASDDYRLANTGSVAIEQSDLTDVTDSSGLQSLIDSASFSGGTSNTAWNVWTGNRGTVISFQDLGDIGASVQFYAVEEDENDNPIRGSLVDQAGTAPGDTTSVNTNNLPDPSGEYFVGFNENTDNLAYLDLRPLNLEAQFTEDEVTADDQLELEVESNDIADTAFSGDVQAWFYEADEELTPDNVIHVETGQFDGDGSEDITVDPQQDLDGEGDYKAVVAHTESQVIATAGVAEPVSVVEPLDQSVEIVRPRQTDEPYARGDIIEFQLDLQGTDTATLTFGDRAAGQNVEVNITVRTQEVGGTANFLLNTFQIGDGFVRNDSVPGVGEVRNTGIAGDDWGDEQHGVISQGDTTVVDVEAHENIRIGGGSNDNNQRRVVIADGSYDLTASPGETSYLAGGSISTDNSIVRLEPRDFDGVETFEAPTPGDEAEIADIEFVDAEDSSVFDIEAALDQGLITSLDSALAEEDIFIVRIGATGLEGLLADQAEDNDNLDEFLNRNEDHNVTGAFFDSNFLSLRANQSQAQVEEIVEDVREERAEERNLPADNTFGAQATLELTEEEVLAGSNDRQGVRDNLDEYYLTVQVNEDNINDLRADDFATIGDLFSIDTDGDGDADPIAAPTAPDDVVDRIINNADEDNEIRTADQRPVTFNTTFTVGTGIGDSNASAFPENAVFGDTNSDRIEFNLAADTVQLADVEQTPDGPRIFVPAENNYTIEGTTQIAAGTSMTSQTQTASGEDPAFFYPNEFTVQYVEDGPNTISFTEDFLDNEEIGEDENFAGADFRMTIRRARLPGNLLADAPRRGLPGTVAAITEVDAHTFEDQETAGAAVTIAEVNVSESATIEVRDADGTVLGTAEVPAGLTENVNIALEETLEESQNLTSVLLDDDGNEFQEGPSSQTAQVDVVGDEPLYLVNNLQPLTATAAPGDTLDISADITNRGGEGDGSGQTITLTAGPVEATQTVTVAPGETQTVTFEGVTVPDVEQETTVTHAIASADDSAEGSLTISPQDPAFFEITDFSPEEATVTAGDSVEASVTIENTGDVEGTRTVTLSADGGLGELGSQEVTLGPGETVSETFTFTAPDVDSETTVTHTLDTEDDSVSGTLTVEPAEEPGDDTGTDTDTGNETDEGGDGSSDDGGPGFGIAAALVAIIGAALLAYRRQQN